MLLVVSKEIVYFIYCLQKRVLFLFTFILNRNAARVFNNYIGIQKFSKHITYDIKKHNNWITGICSSGSNNSVID